MAVDMKLVEWIKANRLKLSRAEMIQQSKAEGEKVLNWLQPTSA